MTKRIIQLVDSIAYISTNCFQHQLAFSLDRACDLIQVELKDVLNRTSGWFDKIGGLDADGIVSCLKLRTLFAHAEAIGRILRRSGNLQLVVYDQDPWEAFKDGGPYKGAYHNIAKHVNVRSFAVTTKLWADLVASKGLPSTFVRMWVLPPYCDASPPYVERYVKLGFVGTVHDRRKKLFDELARLGTPVAVRSGNSLPYAEFLKALSSTGITVNNQDEALTVDGQPMNMRDTMWVRDIEAVARGCFVIRNRGVGAETYLEGIETVRMYDDVKQVPFIVDQIEHMDAVERQAMVDRSVATCKNDVWQETADTLITCASERG